MSKNLGNGAVLSFSDTTNVLAVTKITAGSWSRARVDCSGLEDEGGRKYLPGTLYDHDELQVEGYWDSLEDLMLPLDSGSAYHEFPVAETITLTWPLGTGETTAAKLVGTGFITGITFPEFEDDVIQAGMFTVSWDGNTGPKYTEATPTEATPVA